MAVPKLLKMLGMADAEYQLFDKFINVELEEYLDEEGLEKKLIEKYVDTGAGFLNIPNLLMGNLAIREDLIKANAEHFTILTREKGCKPYISLQAEFLPQNRCTKVTVTIHNLETEVNINTFSVCRVTAGYYNGLQRSFMGFIINSYVESANPNGNTVFQFFDGGFVGELITPREQYLEMSGKVKWVDALEKAVKSSGFGFQNDISEDKAPGAQKSLQELYDEVPCFGVGSFKKRFKSGNDIVNWFNRIGKKIFYDYGLEPPRIIVENGTIRLTVTGQDVWEGGDLPLMDYIKTARYIGGAVEIKAPWNPMIMPLKGFICDPNYFRGRLNAQAVNQANHLINLIKVGKEADNLSPGVDSEGKYTAITVSINFDTRNTNEMTVTGVSLTQMQNSEGLQKAIDKSNEFGYGGGGKLKLPDNTEEEQLEETVETESSLSKTELWETYAFQDGDQGYFLFGYGDRSYVKGEHIFNGFWNKMMEFSADHKDLWMQKDIPGQKPGAYNTMLNDELNKERGLEQTGIPIGAKVRFPKEWKQYLNLDMPTATARRLERYNSVRDSNKKVITPACPNQMIEIPKAVAKTATVGDKTPKKMLPAPKDIDGKSVFSEVLKSHYDKIKPLVTGGGVLSFPYGWIADSKNKLTKLRDVKNKAFNNISDYFDLAPAVLYFKYKDFDADDLRQEFRMKVINIHTDPDFPVREFALSTAGLAALQIIAQRDWYEANAEKDDAKAYSQLMGFSKKYPANNASFNKPKQIVETEMNIAFPNWDTALVYSEDIAQYFTDLAEWCGWNPQYRIYHDMLQIDALNILRLKQE